jgi:hypothetical protein
MGGAGATRPRRQRVLLGMTLVAALVGALLSWLAIDRLDDAGRRLALVQSDVGDVDRLIDARIEEAVGTTGLDTGTPGAADQLHVLLADMAMRAGVPAGRATDIEDMVDALVTGAGPGDSVDEERLLVLRGAVGDLGEEALADAVADLDQARRTGVVTAVTGILLVAALATAAARSAR